MRTHSVVSGGHKRLVVRNAQHVRDVRFGNGRTVIQVQQVVGIGYVKCVCGIWGVKLEYALFFVVDYRHRVTSLNYFPVIG